MNLDNTKIDTKRPAGITVFSVLIIVSSIIHMSTLYHHSDWYADLYVSWPAWLMHVRFGFSWVQRIIGLLIAFGLLFRKEFCRKLGILLGCFTIFTIYWKHPYEAFLKSNQALDRILGPILQSSGIQDAMLSIGFSRIDFSAVTLTSIVLHSLLDIIFWLAFTYYFTRVKVKKHFMLTVK